MLCPYCQTDNRDDREACYHCSKDISMLRLIVNKAKHHYNTALEHAERGRTDEAAGELRNALDLDATMANAFVVLGTLYAQQEKFDEAKQAWHKALALDHRLEKAHDYLNKSEQAQFEFPAIRRLRRLAAALILLLIGSLVAIGFLLVISTRAPKRMLSAELQGKPMLSAQARDVAVNFMNNPEAPEATRKYAEEMKGQIEAGWQEQLNFATAALNDNPSLALQLVDALDARQPDKSVGNSTARLRTLAIQAISQKLEQAAADFSTNKVPFEDVDAQGRTAIAALPAGPARTRAEELLKKVAAEYRERTLGDAERVLNDSPLPFAINQYRLWKARMPELGPKLDTLLEARLAAEAQTAYTQARGDIGAGEFDSAARRLDAITTMYTSAGRTVPRTRIDPIRGELAAAQNAHRLADVQKLFGAKQWEAFLAASERPEGLTSDTVTQTQLKAQRDQAWRAFAEETFTWMEARDAKFEAGAASNDEAARVLRTYEAVIQHLPKRLEYAKGPILFYAASSHMKLGENDKARELIEQIRRDDPKSYINKSLEKFRKRFGERLGLAADTEPPARKEATHDTEGAAAPEQPAATPAPTPKAPKPTPAPENDAAKPQLPPVGASPPATAATPKTAKQADADDNADEKAPGDANKAAGGGKRADEAADESEKSEPN